MVSIETIRALHFVPASRSELFTKAAASGADAIILDLEDAVAPEDKKSTRAALRRHCHVKSTIFCAGLLSGNEQHIPRAPPFSADNNPRGSLALLSFSAEFS